MRMRKYKVGGRKYKVEGIWGEPPYTIYYLLHTEYLLLSTG